ncbi:MAG: hypothetical protein WCK01_04235 [Candidatus Uhrbacteria bacterium]
MAKKVTLDQYLQFGRMVSAGAVSCELMQAILEERVEIIEKPREQTGSPYRGGVPSSETREPIGSSHRLHVSYAKLLGVKALEPEFSGKNSVSVLYDGREWTRHTSCAKIDQTPGERDFLVAEIPAEFLGKRIDTIEDALAECFHPPGFRFAIETEAVEFAHDHQQLYRKNWIYALGSSALFDGGRRGVAMLYADGRDCFLGGGWVGDGLHDSGRLLLVRKVSTTLGPSGSWCLKKSLSP